MADPPGVLVVDDDSTIRSVIAELLLVEGYLVRTAVNGRDALEVLRAWRPCVIVLDLMMPVMDGWAFRAAQRALPGALREIPVIILSATRDVERHAAELGAATAISKPFDLDQVVTTVAAIAGRP
ncbi:MAG TPA: response regulator [Thermomicrobiaceae bacterium]|nr:response regulator [Thermomicrobiaceae bacterium]